MARTPQQQRRARRREWMLRAMGVSQAVEPEALVFFERAGDLTAPRRAQINALVLGLKKALNISNLADFFDVLCVANETQTASLTNIAKKAHDATIVSTVTFAADRGFTGNGTSGYLSSNCTLSSATRYAQNDAHISAYSRTSRTESATYKTLIGVAHSAGVRLARIIPIGVDGNARLGINHDGSDSWLSNPANELGYHILNRIGSSAFSYYRNNALHMTRTSITSTAPAGFPPFIGAYSTAGTASLFSDSQIAAWTIGRGFATDAQAIAAGVVIEAYMDAIGAGVL